MQFNEVTNKEQWESQLSTQTRAQFLQSWDWGEFQKSLGRKVWRQEIGSSYISVIKMGLPLEQNYLYAPRLNFLLNKDVSDELKKLAAAEKSIFLRLELVPVQELDLFGFQKTNNVQPGKTLLLDLTKSAEELLAVMHPKTRYNIRLAEKKGVEIREGSQSDLDNFYDLISSTYNRKHLKVYNKGYYQKLLENLTNAKIYLAEYQNKILAANLILFYGDTATYLHGGSSEEDKNIMAPHLLQWEIIKLAKAQGYRYYDFWGIDEKKWPGVTRFKMGFGGTEVKYGGAFDLILNKFWYTVYKLIKSFK
jgi:peptidoglycan pentaglycine glycine transferase (the first glycine)